MKAPFLILLFFVPFLLFINLGCSSSDTPIQLNNDGTIKEVFLRDYTFPYDLGKPKDVFYLDRKLIEISGLSLTPDSSELVCLNDEIGRIFFLEKNSGALLSSFEFGVNGDYEGVEFVNGKYYVVKSNGTLFSIDPSSHQVTIENTFLTSANDVEGLSYWSKKNRLMIACKGSPSGKNKYKKSKAVYDFDLGKNKLKKKPMFLITHEKIKDFIAAKNASGIKEKILKKIQINDALSFAPSGIAVHPISQYIYILSANGKTLFVVDENGEILHIEFLQKSKFIKPEGIAIDSDGTLYISNEGKEAKASLMKFQFNQIEN